MNVFEYLGSSADHRPENKVVQLVKHLDEVPASKRHWPAIAQTKKDGVFCLVVTTGSLTGLFSRVGKKFTNVEWLESEINEFGLCDAVRIAELCNDYLSLEELSGAVNPNRVDTLSSDLQRKMESCYLAFHDYLSIEDFLSGRSQIPYKCRQAGLESNIAGNGFGYILPCVLVADEEEFDSFAKAQIAMGEEGVVGKDPNADWEAGHKGWRAFKKVKGVSYDLVCLRVEEGKGKYAGRAANLFFRWKDGKEVKAMLGKGWTHEAAREVFLNPPVGDIFQVYALCESSKGKLRNPKVGVLRHDKTEPDF